MTNSGHICWYKKGQDVLIMTENSICKETKILDLIEFLRNTICNVCFL
jgi:hypothetical protein